MYPYRQSPQAYYPAQQAVNVPALLGQVLGITGIAFLITALAAYLFQGVSYGVGMGAMLLGLLLIFGVYGARSNPQTALLIFYAFAFLEGIGIAPTITHYVRAIGPQPVIDAATTTGFGMFVLGAVAFTFSIDWRRFSGLAFGALLALVIVGLIAAFTHFMHPGVYAWMTLGVFTLLTLIDFSRIRAGGGGSTPVELALSIYLDAINIFIAFLEIFGLRSRDD